MAKAPKAVVEPVLVPGRMRDCSALIKRLGEVRRDLERTETAMNAELATVNTKHQKLAEPFVKEAASLERRIEAYCDKWRGPLTGGGKRKSFKFPDGDISWRKLPAKVSLRGVEKVIEFCQGKRAFAKFIRVAIEPNKQAMLDDPKHALKIPGVSIGSDGETFDIAPFETCLEEVA
ncbi:host-nuclease inhibitor Gam family protein [Hypericibacter sp.]|uniref:host-nuclease inhibitor Gam family protein n=1 Tax=Hypericibacter sp. TaxID=2705401 RepID=UPI003D6D943D